MQDSQNAMSEISSLRLAIATAERLWSDWDGADHAAGRILDDAFHNVFSKATNVRNAGQNAIDYWLERSDNCEETR